MNIQSSKKTLDYLDGQVQVDKAYSGPYQTSMKKFFEKILKS